MNMNMNGVQLAPQPEASVMARDGEITGFVDLSEGKGRTGSATLYFHSSDDCEAVAKRLSEIADWMRALEKGAAA